ncbi:MAG: dual specificity protein phosphatase family protein [Acidobacteriota bacterium]
MKKTLVRRSSTILLAIIALALASFAQTSPSEFKGVKIQSFGQMEPGFFRGAQPLPDDYQSLKDLGVKTVVDLQSDPTDYEKVDVEALGMKYVNIPMSGYKTPRMDDINTFLALVNNPDTGTIYVHCKAGIHRTGVMGAAYRFTKSGWDYDKAYTEMKNYNFSAGLVHGSFKSFVRDWSDRLIHDKAAAGASTAPSSSTAAISASAKTSN